MTLIGPSDFESPCPGCGTVVYVSPDDPSRSLGTCKVCGKYQLVMPPDDGNDEPALATPGYELPGPRYESEPGRWLLPEWEPVSTEPPSETPAPMESIWYHGERSYSFHECIPVVVSNEQHAILKLFLDREAALDTDALKNTVSNVAKVIKTLAEKFPGTVRRPGGNKGEGYYIRVRTKVATR